MKRKELTKTFRLYHNMMISNIVKAVLPWGHMPSADIFLHHIIISYKIDFLTIVYSDNMYINQGFFVKYDI